MPQQPVVIRAQVRARLLGIPLLTLAARIVADGREDDVLLIPAARAAGQPGTGVARARLLVGEARSLTARG